MQMCVPFGKVMFGVFCPVMRIVGTGVAVTRNRRAIVPEIIPVGKQKCGKVWSRCASNPPQFFKYACD